MSDPDAPWLLLPGSIEARTGGSIYDRRIVEGLEASGRPVRVRSLDISFPAPDSAALADAAQALAEIPSGARVVIDGLALGAMPEAAAAERTRLQLLALVHHPLYLEAGLAPERQQALQRSEALALRQVRHVIVTSPTTARLLGALGVGAERISVVVPGTDPAPPARGSGEPAPRLLCVGSVTPRKGHLLLVDALATLRHLPWQLDCVGTLNRDTETAAALGRRIRALGLGQRIRLHGEISEARLSALYDSADLFVLPSLFEGYGMAYTEALARGLPVLGTTAGAIPATVPAGAGLLIDPGSAPALGAMLRRVLTDDALRRRLTRNALQARTALPDWNAAARRFAEVLDRV